MPISHRTNLELSQIEDSVIEKELQKINENLNEFTLEQFEDLRQQIKQQGFYRPVVE
jgi:hypothetical protein